MDTVSNDPRIRRVSQTIQSNHRRDPRLQAAVDATRAQMLGRDDVKITERFVQNNLGRVTAVAKMLLMAIAVLALAMSAAGCADPKRPLLREGLNAAAQPVFSDYRRWGQDRVAAGKLTQQDLELRLRSIEEFNKLVQQDRASK
jgi:hypothetical protein